MIVFEVEKTEKSTFLWTLVTGKSPEDQLTLEEMSDIICITKTYSKYLMRGTSRKDLDTLNTLLESAGGVERLGLKDFLLKSMRDETEYDKAIEDENESEPEAQSTNDPGFDALTGLGKMISELIDEDIDGFSPIACGDDEKDGEMMGDFSQFAEAEKGKSLREITTDRILTIVVAVAGVDDDKMVQEMMDDARKDLEKLNNSELLDRYSSMLALPMIAAATGGTMAKSGVAAGAGG